MLDVLRKAAAGALLGLALMTTGTLAQERHGTLERIKVHGVHLEGNLSGDPADRDVSVYLPPSYNTDKTRRYPVVYLLHGYGGTDYGWYSDQTHYIVVPNTADAAINAGSIGEVIMVTPNARTLFQGSFYSNSVTTGDWEDFIAHDLVDYIDSHYRTLANAASRGLSGHSMGGYGTLRIGMKHPEIFSSIYLLSAGPIGKLGLNSAQDIAKVESIKTIEDFTAQDAMLRRIIFAAAAAWSPNPARTPFYLDLPVKDGQYDRVVMSKFAANQPLSMIDQYIPNLRKLTAIGFDAGTQDTGIAANLKQLDEILTRYSIAHQFEIYDGDHTNKIAERVETRMLPFFGKHLSFTAPK